MTLTDRLREKISQAFYNHGLLCASYPIPIILFTGLCIVACWYVSELPWMRRACVLGQQVSPPWLLCSP